MDDGALLTNFKFALLINIPIKAIFIFTNRLLSPQHFWLIFVTSSLIHSPTPKEGCYRIPPLSSNCPQPLECLHCANRWPPAPHLPQFSTIPHQNGQIQIVVAFSSLAPHCSFVVLQSRSRFNKFGVDSVFGPQTGPIITVMGMGALVTIQWTMKGNIYSWFPIIHPNRWQKVVLHMMCSAAIHKGKRSNLGQQEKGQSQWQKMAPEKRLVNSYYFHFL